MKSRFRKTILAALAVIALVGAVASWKYLSDRDASSRLIFSGTIEADEIHVGSKVGGRIAAVLVEEGQLVEQGQALLRFESYDLEAKRDEAKAAVAQAEANLQKVLAWFRPEEVAEAKAQAEAAWMSLELARNGPRPQEVEAARAELNAAEADYEIARLSLTRLEKLATDGVVSSQDLDNARSDFDRARARREAARQRRDLLEAGTRSEEIERAERQYRQAAARKELVERGARKEDVAAAQAQLERARATLKGIETQLAELEVAAPSRAAIEVLRVRPGDLIAPGAPVATLVETDRMWVRVYVPQPQLGLVRLGADVTVRTDTNETVPGRIEHIATRGEFTPRNVQTREERAHQVFGVRVQVTGGTDRLRPGMAADVVIQK